MKRHVAIAIGLGMLLAATPAAAFHQLMSYRVSANTGGGANYYFTGSPRFKGYECSMCHTEAEGRIRMELTSDPVELQEGVYVPGVRYTIDLRLIGEHRGLESAFNPNTFTAEITDVDGEVGGRFGIARRQPMAITADERVVSGDGFGEGENEWRFFWVAPEAADARPFKLYIGMLDGDGATDPENRRIDAINDDVATMVLALCPEGEECPEPELPVKNRSTAQCSAGTADPTTWLMLVLIIGLLRRRRLV